MGWVQTKKQKSYVGSVLYLSYFTEKANYSMGIGFIPPVNIVTVLFFTKFKVILAQESKKKIGNMTKLLSVI